jgi:hypothetical protein
MCPFPIEYGNVACEEIHLRQYRELHIADNRNFAALMQRMDG